MTPQEQERQAAIDAFNQQRNTPVTWARDIQDTFTAIGVSLSRTVEAMQPWFNAYVRASETFSRALFRICFPDEAKRMMLREARRRARLSTQRRRIAR